MKQIIALVAVVCFLLPSAEGAMIHRWSFDSDGSDSVGTAHATLVSGAVVSQGRLQLSGSGANATLPIDASLAGLSSASFEVWVTHDQLTSYPRIFDFGNGNATSSPNTGYFFLTGSPNFAPIRSFAQFSITRTTNTNSENLYAGNIPGPGVMVHLTVVIDATTDTGRVYLNGVMIHSATISLTPGEVVLQDGQEHNWLGRSRFSSDAFLDGSIDEFRIYDHALSSAEILANYQLGPGQTSYQLIPPSVSEGVVTFSIPTVTGLAFEIQYSDVIPVTNWESIPVVPGNGTTLQINDPDPASPHRFYRMVVRGAQ